MGTEATDLTGSPVFFPDSISWKDDTGALAAALPKGEAALLYEPKPPTTGLTGVVDAAEAVGDPKMDGVDGWPKTERPPRVVGAPKVGVEVEVDRMDPGDVVGVVEPNADTCFGGSGVLKNGEDESLNPPPLPLNMPKPVAGLKTLEAAGVPTGVVPPDPALEGVVGDAGRDVAGEPAPLSGEAGG